MLIIKRLPATEIESTNGRGGREKPNHMTEERLVIYKLFNTLWDLAKNFQIKGGYRN
jgi:hypothetical protein